MCVILWNMYNNFYPQLNFNNDSVKQALFQKHLGLCLDSNWDFGKHLQKMFKRKTSQLWKLPYSSPRARLTTIYKSFIRQHLDYGDILYDQTFTGTVMQIYDQFNTNKNSEIFAFMAVLVFNFIDL